MTKKFNYCPNCSSQNFEFKNNHKLFCGDCNFEFYQNVAAAVAVIITDGERILFVKRNKDPKKGYLDLPGGFVDPYESAEEACKRELKEEINLDFSIERLQYFSSAANEYLYKDILYRTQDLAYILHIEKETNFQIEPEEIQDVKWIKLEDIDVSEIGFESLQRIIKKYLYLVSSKKK